MECVLCHHGPVWERTAHEVGIVGDCKGVGVTDGCDCQMQIWKDQSFENGWTANATHEGWQAGCCSSLPGGHGLGN